MKTNSSIGLYRVLFAVGILSATPLLADTLVYSEQNNNPAWFSPGNWFAYDVNHSLQPVGHPPVAGDTAIVGGTVDAQGDQIPLAGLILQPNATIRNGAFVVGTIQMNGGINGGETSFNASAVEVLTEMDVIGGSCELVNASLRIDFGAICYIGFNGAGQLSYSGSQILNAGQISLQYGDSFLEGATNLSNLSGAIISSSTNAYLTGDPGSTFDNSGTVRSDLGTITISGFQNWPSSSGISKYKTTAPQAKITFPGLTIPAGVTNIFSGLGSNFLTGQATINGTAQIGVIDGNSGNLDPGALQFNGQLGGSGIIHVVALPTLASILSVTPNVGGTITGLVVNIDFGAQWLINYTLNGQGVTLVNAVINNYGTITMTNDCTIALNNGAAINNLPGGLFDAQTNYPITGGGLPFGGVINNSGTFRKSAGGGTAILTVDFINTGTLDVESGQVQLAGGTNSSLFNTAPGAEIWISVFNRTNVFAPGALFSGTNVLRAKNGTVFLTGNVNLANFSLEGGTLDGPGQITATNLFQWSSGMMQGVGSVIVPAGANALLTGGTFTQRTLNNSGTVTMTNGFIGADNAAIFNNLAGGVLQLQKNGGFGFPNSTAPRPVLNNFGSIISSSPVTAPLAFIITNNGSVLLQSNQFNCYQYIQLSGQTTIATNATLDSQSFATLFQGGLITGNGAITGSYGVTNTGATLRPGASPGILTVNNNPYTQGPLGTLAIEIGGTNAGSQFDQLAVPGAALNGALTVSLVNGFLPSPGDHYPIITTPYFGSITGKFSQLTGLLTGSNVALVPVYGSFGVTLIAVAEPTLASPLHTGTNFAFGFATAAGVTNTVQYTDSLNPANWLTLTNFLGDGTVKSFTNGSLSPQRFYRVELH